MTQQLKCYVLVGVRKQGRLSGHEGAFVPITQQVIDVPEDFLTQGLAVAVTVEQVLAARKEARGLSEQMDTVEFFVDLFDPEADPNDRPSVHKHRTAQRDGA